MNLLCYLVNRLWVSLCRTEYKRFLKSMQHVRQVQHEVLSAILKENSHTAYGMEFGFNTIQSTGEFQEKVPLTTYEDYAEYIQRIKAGERAVLTEEPVIMLELSSGSTSSSKYIPYTKSLKKQFIYGINPWVHNLYQSCKGPMNGKAYWSVTPVIAKKERTEGGIPVGFEEDSQYFGRVEKYILDFLFAVPGEVKHIQDSQVFHYITLLFLLKERRLAFISIWNPTFLLLLLKPVQSYKKSLLQDLAEGTVTPPARISDELLHEFQKKLGRNVHRAEELKRVFTLYGINEIIKGRSVFESIWPELKLISCWTDASAELFIPQLKRLFPNVEIQGKGLLATEAFVSFPFYKDEGALLSIRSHFFEFEELDKNRVFTGNIRLAHELVINSLYSVVVTTGGGFYRYRLQDIVKVVGFTLDCPRLKFIGKGEKISDLCGEKLNDLHVKCVVENALSENNLFAEFYLVAPEVEEGSSGYALFIELAQIVALDENVLVKFVKDVEAGLRENFHYNYCRQLGQLRELRLFLIKGNGNHIGIETYQRTCRMHGQREGNIKPCALHNKTGWVREFTGSFLEV